MDERNDLFEKKYKCEEINFIYFQVMNVYGTCLLSFTIAAHALGGVRADLHSGPISHVEPLGPGAHSGDITHQGGLDDNSFMERQQRAPLR